MAGDPRPVAWPGQAERGIRRTAGGACNPDASFDRGCAVRYRFCFRFSDICLECGGQAPPSRCTTIYCLVWTLGDEWIAGASELDRRRLVITCDPCRWRWRAGYSAGFQLDRREAAHPGQSIV